MVHVLHFYFKMNDAVAIQELRGAKYAHKISSYTREKSGEKGA